MFYLSFFFFYIHTGNIVKWEYFGSPHLCGDDNGYVGATIEYKKYVA